MPWRFETSGHASPQAVLHWALARYPDLVLPSGFNLNGVVLIDLAVAAGYRGEVVFVDTGAHFPETLLTRDRVAARYPVRMVTLRAPNASALPVCGSATCCSSRKLAPLRAYLEERRPSALLSARSRDQGATRSRLRSVETGGDYLKINPLAYVARADLESYAAAHALPVNPLYDQGFLSIGCQPTTRAVAPDEDVRAGRWPGQAKTECGLWQGEKAL